MELFRIINKRLDSVERETFKLEKDIQSLVELVVSWDYGPPSKVLANTNISTTVGCIDTGVARITGGLRKSANEIDLNSRNAHKLHLSRGADMGPTSPLIFRLHSLLWMNSLSK